ncbi:MAG TPA: hypothetical protein P5318_03480 [Candidatus Hydrogenedentes bacterium]|nr:hypothetical protein [Candidatus Hydrogenedentota bacterium]HPC14976.1 hypothetical protein [Candidatus Hydrogenedentota bacterium]HRT19163.1 hypothetical protein [Candidatus Hydrogenedentota bacterium]HRT64092.1 hypothetical protein [Candidatus Hydrogenedentota bacterium]
MPAVAGFDWFGHVLILAGVCSAAAAQLIVKWAVNRAGIPPEELFGKVLFVFKVFFSPWPWLGVAVVFVGGVCWTASMSRFEISYSYPFMSLAFVIVMIASALLLGETLAWQKIAGTGLVVLGLILLAR